jgi:hypothetical protein
MRGAAAVVVAGAVLAAPAGADASLSAARAEREARRAVAPLLVESVACFKTTPQPRRTKARIAKRICVVTVPSGNEATCIVTVAVRQRSKPRRVSSKVTIPLRCFNLREWDATG